MDCESDASSSKKWEEKRRDGEEGTGVHLLKGITKMQHQSSLSITFV
jgi:hypothetical protein